ncbi:MAG TPA: hypothetical protein VGK40_04180 [Verrucomicrobiae bacterium]|jgi:hypothetical protein
MTANEILAEVSKLTLTERIEFERLWHAAFADELRERRLAELRAEIQRGLDQLDRGDCTLVTDRTLDEIEAEAVHDAPTKRTQG